MASKKITPEQAAVHVYNVSHSALEVVSNVYKNTLLAGSRYLDEKTDNALGRLSGAAYMAKTLHAVVGGFKDVEKKKLANILLDGKMGFKDKVKESVKHVQDKFSHESTVAAGMFFGKEALVIAPIALGVTALVGLTAPAAAATAGLVAGVGLMQAAAYYLSTHAGHKLETTMAEKVKAGMHFVTGYRRAVKGDDQEYKQMHEVGVKMEEAARAQAQWAAPHETGGRHEHGGAQRHHQKFGHTFKQDLITLARVDKYPAELVKFTKGIAQDCVSLFNKVAGTSLSIGQDVKSRPSESKFMQERHASNVAPAPGAAETNITVKTDQDKSLPAKKSQPPKLGR